MKFKKSSIVATVAAIGIIGSATAAYAFVATTGVGNGNGSKVVASDNFTLDVDIENPQTLVPGASAAVTVKVTNNSTANGKIKFTNVNLSLPATPQGTCDAAAWATLSIADPASQTATLQKGQSATFTGTVSLADSDTVDQTCLLGQDLNVTANVS
jgi:hypothetical protein